MSIVLYSWLADLVAIIHLMYAAAIVLGLLAITVGGIRGWRWVRHPWLRVIHLVMITIVVFEAWAGITCPLTTLENHLRVLADQPLEGATVFGRAVHVLLFFDAPWYVFTACYTACGALIVLTLVLFPPHWNDTFRQSHLDS